MTREEAIDWLARLKSNTVNHTLDMPLWWNEPLAEALDMAIKALEQEPCVTMRDLSEEELKHFAEEMKKVRPQVVKQESVIDKIRAEIENHCGLAKEDHCKYCSYCNNLMGVREILEIIDKYKEESEGE